METLILDRNALNSIIGHLYKEEAVIERYGSYERFADLVEDALDEMNWHKELEETFESQIKEAIKEVIP